MELNGRFKLENMGEFKLKGKEQDMTLYSVEPVIEWIQDLRNQGK